MARKDSAIATALRSEFPSLVQAARELVLEAQRRATTTAEAAEALGMSVRTLERIRADFPELAVHIRERGRPPKAEVRRANPTRNRAKKG